MSSKNKTVPKLLQALVKTMFRTNKQTHKLTNQTMQCTTTRVKLPIFRAGGGIGEGRTPSMPLKRQGNAHDAWDCRALDAHDAIPLGGLCLYDEFRR